MKMICVQSLAAVLTGWRAARIFWDDGWGDVLPQLNPGSTAPIWMGANGSFRQIDQQARHVWI